MLSFFIFRVGDVTNDMTPDNFKDPSSQRILCCRQRNSDYHAETALVLDNDCNTRQFPQLHPKYSISYLEIEKIK